MNTNTFIIRVDASESIGLGHLARCFLIANFIKHKGGLKINRFLQKILDDDVISAEFQKFLATNQLSSHAWVIGKKLEKEN